MKVYLLRKHPDLSPEVVYDIDMFSDYTEAINHIKDADDGDVYTYFITEFEVKI